MKKNLVLLASFLTMCVQADNLRDVVVAAGGTPLQGYDDILTPSETVAARAFDGVCTNALGDNARCLGGAQNKMFVTFGFPDSLVPAGKKLAVTRYRVYQLNGGSSAHARAPRAWTLSGSADNSAFTAVDSRSDVTWYADSHTIGNDDPLPAGVDNWHEYALDPSVETNWRYFKFVPTKSNVTGGWRYVIEELEFYGTVYDPKDGYCELQMPALDVGEVFPAYGAVTATGATFRVASRTVEYKGTPYSLTGWKLEKWQDSAWTAAGSGSEASYTYVPDGSICRFSWVWEVGTCQLTTSVLKDLGCESVTCSPASEKGDGKYPGGTVVTLTAHPATSPHASAFVRWTGDLPSGADATNPELTVTMDGPRNIQAVFDRSDWPWTFVSDGASSLSGALTDGNWKFAVEETEEDGLTGVCLAEVVFGDGFLDLTAVKADSGVVLLSIADDLFKQNKIITGVAFNNELRRTGAYSFSDSAVGSVQFGTDLVNLGERTFKNSSLDGTADMSVCTNLTVLSRESFNMCNRLKGIVLPPRLRQINNKALAEMAQLKTIGCTVPPEQWRLEMKRQPLSIVDDAIGGCPVLETLELPCGGRIPLTNMRGLTMLKTLTINGKPPASVGDIFTKWGNYSPQPAYQLQIVVSPARDRAGWEALATRAPTEEEKQRADYPGSDAFGVLDAPEASRAWLVWGETMFKPQGLTISIR